MRISFDNTRGSDDDLAIPNSEEAFDGQKTTESYANMDQVDADDMPWPVEIQEAIGRLERLRRVGVVPVETTTTAELEHTETSDHRVATGLGERIDRWRYGHPMYTPAPFEHHDDEGYSRKLGDQTTPYNVRGNDVDIEHDDYDSEDYLVEAQLGHSLMTVMLVEEHDDEYYGLRFGEEATADNATAHSTSSPGYGPNREGADDDFDGIQFAHSLLTVVLIEQYDDEYYDLRFGDRDAAHDTTHPSALVQASPPGYGANCVGSEDDFDGVQFAHSMLTVTLIEQYDDEFYGVMFSGEASTTPASPLGYSGNDVDVEDESDD